MGREPNHPQKPFPLLWRGCLAASLAGRLLKTAFDHSLGAEAELHWLARLSKALRKTGNGTTNGGEGAGGKEARPNPGFLRVNNI